ncbi:hypothetical protein [Vibrio alfacsensis]|uniref:hypothetical protein n=1 Tax=Vibrio alfacsensis TaxID=1074311 RepID=UPI004068F13D
MNRARLETRLQAVERRLDKPEPLIIEIMPLGCTPEDNYTDSVNEGGHTIRFYVRPPISEVKITRGK